MYARKRPLPLCVYSVIPTITYKVVVYATTERADKLPLFLLYSYTVCTLWCPALQFLIVHSSYIWKNIPFFNSAGIITCVQLCEKHILRLQKYCNRKIPETALRCPDTETPRNFHFKYTVFCNTVLDKKERTVLERNNNKRWKYHPFM